MVAHYGCILRWDYIRTELKKDFFVKLKRNKNKKGYKPLAFCHGL
jgi:hypothetical protein